MNDSGKFQEVESNQSGGVVLRSHSTLAQAVFAQEFQSGKLNCGTHCSMFFVK